jgi:ceramide glucosyltransferase
MFLKPDYLRSIVAPLADETVGVSCTLYKAWKADKLEEYLELLSFNADFVPSMVFATVTQASIACPGASQAIRREVLAKIGGLAPLAHYLVEDFELGRRVIQAGYRIQFVPYVAATGVDLKNFKAWWRHQVYWDQNTRAAAGIGFFFTFLIRGIPFACLYTLIGGSHAKLVLSLTLGVRLVTTGVNSFFFLSDRDGLKSLVLLPIRDVLSLFVWFASFVKRKTFWRGRTFIIRKGKLVEAPS